MIIVHVIQSQDRIVLLPSVENPRFDYRSCYSIPSVALTSVGCARLQRAAVVSTCRLDVTRLATFAWPRARAVEPPAVAEPTGGTDELRATVHPPPRWIHQWLIDNAGRDSFLLPFKVETAVSQVETFLSRHIVRRGPGGGL